MVAFLKEMGFQSVCALPLTTVHRRIGSIAVASKRPDAYCNEEVRFLSLVNHLWLTLSQGLVIPEVLRPYMQGRDFLKFARELPKGWQKKQA